MHGSGRNSLVRTAWLTALVAGLAGCVTTGGDRIVKSGDPVNLRFTCRFPSGDLAATTYPALVEDARISKSAVFIPKKDGEPVPVTAGERIGNPNRGQGLEFEYAIADRLADLAVGKPLGEAWSAAVTAERTPVRDGERQALELALVRVRPKEVRLTREEFCRQSECSADGPRLGDPFAYDPQFHGSVTGLKEDEVVVSIKPPPGGEIVTVFGTGKVRELPDRYEIPLEVKIGRLVRMGGLVGVISEIGDRTFTVDFSHPFGGETLQCDVLAEKGGPAQTASKGEGKK